MKRTFKASAIISGLIERNSPQARKSGRQATFSSDILYETLLKLRSRSPVDANHPRRSVARARGLWSHRRKCLPVTETVLITSFAIASHPLATPLMLEVGRIPVAGAAQDRLLAEAAAELMENSGLANIET